MAVPKTTETRCRDGSVQARQVIKRLHMISAHTVAVSPSVTVNIASLKPIVSSVHSYDRIIHY